jgi:hypothetical protein
MQDYKRQRTSPRFFVMLPILITSRAGAEPRVGITRNISKNGIFFYSNLTPKLHSNIDLMLQMSGVRISCTGEVVRVEDGRPGAAVGVAVKIQGDNCFLGQEIERLRSALTTSQLAQLAMT